MCGNRDRAVDDAGRGNILDGQRGRQLPGCFFLCRQQGGRLHDAVVRRAVGKLLGSLNEISFGMDEGIPQGDSIVVSGLSSGGRGINGGLGLDVGLAPRRWSHVRVAPAEPRARVARRGGDVSRWKKEAGRRPYGLSLEFCRGSPCFVVVVP